MENKEEFILKVETMGESYILTVINQFTDENCLLLKYKDIKKVIVKCYNEYFLKKEELMNDYNIVSIWDI